MTEIASQRFALEAFSDGGILLDLESGMLLQLNRTSAFVWERILSGIDADEVTAAFSRTFDVDGSVARRDVSAALKLPATDPPLSSSPTEFWYELVGDAYRFSLRGVATLEISASGDAIRWLDGISPSDLSVSLSAVSPKLVALRGASVLHASAVMRPDGTVTAFLGESGAGKTSTARAFARAGLRLLCEDKLVLRLDGGTVGDGIGADVGERVGERVGAVLGAEARLGAWLRDARVRLQAVGPGVWCDSEIPDDTTAGAMAPVTEIVLIDRIRRRGPRIELEPLGATVATAEIFKNGFYGSSAPAEWRRNVNATATIARTARTFRATMPDGLESLDAAARSHAAEATRQ